MYKKIVVVIIVATIILTGCDFIQFQVEESDPYIIKSTDTQYLGFGFMYKFIWLKVIGIDYEAYNGEHILYIDGSCKSSSWTVHSTVTDFQLDNFEGIHDIRALIKTGENVYVELLLDSFLIIDVNNETELDINDIDTQSVKQLMILNVKNLNDSNMFAGFGNLEMLSIYVYDNTSDIIYDRQDDVPCVFTSLPIPPNPSNLKYLSINNTCEFDYNEAVGNFGNLSYLQLSDHGYTTVFELSNDLPNLEVMRIKSFYELKDISGIERCPNLKILSIESASRLKDIEPLMTLSALEKLDITYCERLYDFSPLEKLENLESLILIDNKEIIDVTSISNMKGLKYLHLEDYEKILHEELLDSMVNTDIVIK